MKVALSILGALLLFILLIPTLLSTSFGTRLVSEQLSKRFGYEIKIDSLHLSLIGKQNLEGVRVQNPAHFSLSLPHVHADEGLFTLLVFPDRRGLQVDGGELQFSSLTFSQIQLDLSYKKQQILLHLFSQADSGKISCQAILDRSFQPLSVQATIENLPVQGIDQAASLFAPKFRDLLLLAVGQNLDLQLNARRDPDWNIFCDLHSPLLTTQFHLLSQEDHLLLQAPASFDYTLSPHLVQRLAEVFPAYAPIQLKAPASLHIGVTSLDITDKIQGKASFKTSAIPLQIGKEPLSIEGIEANCTLGDTLFLSAHATTKEMASFDLIVEDDSLRLQGHNLPVGRFSPAWKEWMGTALDINASGTLEKLLVQLSADQIEPVELLLSFKPEISLLQPAQIVYKKIPLRCAVSSFSFPSWQQIQAEAILQIGEDLLPVTHPEIAIKIHSLDNILTHFTSEEIEATVRGRLEQTTFHLAQPLQATCLLSNTLLDLLPFSHPQLAGSSPLSLEIEPFAIDLARPGPTKIAWKGALSIPRLGFPDLSLQNVHIPILCDLSKQALQIDVAAAVANTQGKLQAHAQFSSFSLTDPLSSEIQASLNCSAIPSSLIEAFYPKLPLTPLIGPTFATSCRIKSSPSHQSITLQADSSLLHVSAALQRQDQNLVLQKEGATISWTLSPEGYKALGVTPFALLESTQLQLHIPSGSFPTFAPLSAHFSLQAEIPSLLFLDQTSRKKIQLSQVLCQANRVQGPLSLQVSGKTSCDEKTGKILIDTTLQEESPFVQKALITLEQFPTQILDLLTQSHYSALLGDTLQAKIETSLPGSLQISCQTPRVQTTLFAALQEGVLSLSKPFYAEGLLPPNDTIPLYSHSLITLSIPKAQTTLPLQIEELKVPSGRFELGQVLCRNTNALQQTLSLLRANPSTEPNGDLSLWFAPADFSLTGGVLSLERTEILVAHAFAIALWGNIDLSKNRVNMTLGLTAPTLAKAFQLHHLPDDYVLCISVKGSLDDIKIGTAEAITKITLLIAREQQINTAKPGKGLSIGGILGTLALLPDAGSAPHAKHPFPWETETEKTTKQKSSDKSRKHFKKQENPMKQLMKVLR